MGHLLKTALMGLIVMLWAGLALAQSEYRIKSGDALSIEVLEDPSLNRTVTVLPDGRFSFPFAGALPASGQTVDQVQSGIANAIAPNFASPPTVFVSVRPAPDPLAAPGAEAPLAEETITIYVTGEVGAPGPKQVVPGTTFLQAMAQTGGLTNFAAQKRIQLRRTPPGGQPAVYTFDYKAISRGARLSQDPVLIEGDVILVPERRLFE